MGLLSDSFYFQLDFLPVFIVQLYTIYLRGPLAQLVRAQS
jgi:hypothetical protein